MSRAVLFVIAISLVGLSVPAQEPDFTFGEVPKDDMEMVTYSRDKEAEALVLYDKGETSFVRNEISGQFNTIYKRTRRIKIFKTSAFDLSNVIISYFERRGEDPQRVFDISAFSHTMNGGETQTTALNPSDIIKEKEGDGLYTKKFVIPNVKEGSIIEYRYTIELPNSSAIPDWEFQTDLPVRYSEYQVGITPFYEFTYLLQGRNRFDMTDSKTGEFTKKFANVEYKDIVYRFGMTNLPAFKDDSFITSINDYIIKMDWQLAVIHYPRGGSTEYLSTWPKLSSELLKFEGLGKYVSSSQKAFKKLSSSILTKANMTPLEKAEAITAYVKSNYRWNGLYRKYSEASAKQFMSERVGSTAEINLFLAGLLRGAGLKAHPVLISTRGHGKIKTDYPFQSFFNSSVVIIYIDNQYFLTEGTEPMLPFGLLPPECVNEKGLIITKDSNSWVDLNKSQPSVIVESLDLTLDPENQSLLGQFSKTLNRYDAMIYKKDASRVHRELKDNYELIGDVTQLSKAGLSYDVYGYTATANLEVLGNNIYLQPFLDKPMNANPLKAQTRTYPIDFIYSRKRDFVSTINIPEGYGIESLPSPKQVDDDLLELRYISEQEGDVINIKASYTLKKAVYQPKEYRKLRQHFDLLIDTLNEHVVLKKK